MIRRLTFFPWLYVFVLMIVSLVGWQLFDQVYTFFMSSVIINGLIIGLFFFAAMWLFLVFRRFAKSYSVLKRIAGSATRIGAPASSDDDDDEDEEEEDEDEAPELPVDGSMPGAISLERTMFDIPAMSGVVSSVFRRGSFYLDNTDYGLIVETAKESGRRYLAPAVFLSGIFTMLGLFGTFVGLLQTVVGVGKAFGILGTGEIDVAKLIGALTEPLAGMGTAFSTSLFGLVTSLIINFGIFLASQKLATFVANLESFLASRLSVSAEKEGENLADLLESSLGKLTDGIDTIADSVREVGEIMVESVVKQDEMLAAQVEGSSSLKELLTETLTRGMEETASLSKQMAELSSVLVQSATQQIQYLGGIYQNTGQSNSILNSLGALVESKFSEAISLTRSAVIPRIEAMGNIFSQVVEHAAAISRNTKSTNDGLRMIFTAVSDLNKNLSDIRKDIQHFGNSANEMRRDILGMVETILTDMNINGLQALVSQNARMLDFVQDAMSSLIDYTFKMSVSNENILSVLDMTNDTLAELADSLSSLDGAEIASQLYSLNENFSSYQREMMDFVRGSVEELTGAIMDAAGANERVAQGLEELPYVAEQLGEVTNVMENVGNSMRILTEEVATYVEQTAGTADMLDKLNNDVINSLSSMEAAVYDMIQLLDNMSSYRELVSDIADSIDNLHNVISQVVDVSLNAVDSIYAAIDEQNRSVSQLQESIDNFGINLERIDSLVAVMNDTVDSINNVDDTLRSNVIEEVRYISDNVASLTDAYGQMGDMFANMLDNFIALRDSTEMTQEERTNQMSEMLRYTDDMKLTIDDFSNSFATVADTINQLKEELSNQTETLPTGIIAELERNRQELSSLLLEVLDNLSYVVDGTSNREVVEHVSGLNDEIAKISSFVERSFPNIEYDYSYISETLDRISLLLEDFVASSSGFGVSPDGAGAGSTEVISSIRENSDRMKLVVTAMDAVITEILNSRDVSENILNVLRDYAARN